MKVGMLSHWYDPEGGAAAGPGTIARAIRNRGHKVDVLTGYPIYPVGRVFDGYRVRPYQHEVLRGVDVHRVPAYPSHDANAIRRMGNYLSFAATSSIAAPAVFRRADVGYVYSSPATAATAALPLRALGRLPYIVHVQDVWPDTVTSSGFVDRSTGSAMETVLHKYCNTVYRLAAHVAVTSPGMIDLLHERGVPLEKLSLIPNWAEESSFHPVTRDPYLAASLGLDRNFTVMYAGNLGEMQNLETVVDAAELLRDRKDIGFAFVGGGVREEALRAKVDALNLDNVVFIAPQPFEKMADILALGDCQLVSLKDAPLYRSTMPSKIQANMACARPIIAAVAGDAADVIRQADCGRTAIPGDPHDLQQAIATIADVTVQRRVELGANAEAYYRGHFSEQAVGDRLEALLEESSHIGCSK